MSTPLARDLLLNTISYLEQQKSRGVRSYRMDANLLEGWKEFTSLDAAPSSASLSKIPESKMLILNAKEPMSSDRLAAFDVARGARLGRELEEG